MQEFGGFVMAVKAKEKKKNAKKKENFQGMDIVS